MASVVSLAPELIALVVSFLPVKEDLSDIPLRLRAEPRDVLPHNLFFKRHAATRREMLHVDEWPHNEFRRFPKPSTLNPLFTAAARAAAFMPCLRIMVLKCLNEEHVTSNRCPRPA